MEIYINQEPRNIEEGKNLSGLIADLGIPIKGIALAINNAVVPRKEWEHRLLKTNDRITIIKATQGG